MSADTPPSRALSALAMARTRQLMPEPARLAMDLMCLAGMRVSEVDSLRWGDVNLGTPVISITPLLARERPTFVAIGHLLECALEETCERIQPRPNDLVVPPGWARAYRRAAGASGVLGPGELSPGLLRRTFSEAVGWHPGIWAPDGISRVPLWQHAAKYPDLVAALNDRIATARRLVEQRTPQEAP